MLRQIEQFLGIERFHVSHAERLVSALGACCSILVVMSISRWTLDDPAAYLIIASMGASAVPHGALSQPWPVIGGHLISALIGVSCAKLITPEWIAAPIAVGLAVGAMHYLRCIHPPGGATALAATTGGEQIAALGYGFVVTPVLLNLGVMLLFAVAFNYLFAWRRYPAWFNRRVSVTSAASDSGPPESITHEDFVYALSEIDSFVDVTEDELSRIYDLVVRRLERRHLTVDELQLGHYYSNGKFGENWSVRRIIDWSETADGAERRLIYRIVAGAGRRSNGVCTAMEFSRWAVNEVEPDEQNWRLVPRGDKQD